MKNALRNITSAGFLGLVSSQALATTGSWQSFLAWLKSLLESIVTHNPGTGGGATAVPEIDVMGAGLAIALTGCIIAISREIKKARSRS